jgi:co-chaperonin GroES (HSP10)
MAKIPKSKKLQKEDEAVVEETTVAAPESGVNPINPTIEIRPVTCYNDFVAILQTSIETTIVLANSDGQFKNEGLVIGVGPGIADGYGGRLESQIKIGDYVMFGKRNIAQTLEPSDGPYMGKKVVIVSERNILCELPTQIDFEIVSE